LNREQPTPARPTLRRLTAVFFRIGNTTFGGGNPTMAALQRELVDRKAWITPAVGARILRVPGAIAAVLAVTLQSAALAVLLMVGYESWRTNRFVMAAIPGTADAVARMMFSTVWLVVQPQVRTISRVIVFFGGAFLAAWRPGITPVPIIAIAALAGFLWKEE
jgi:chromate transporter